ncbi:MAG: hypothetical protein H0U76_27825 [Ktedonobacteraceae bacterium]|nr:hypothetical protein [Ktedonobacteraceae bacterium]
MDNKKSVVVVALAFILPAIAIAIVYLANPKYLDLNSLVIVSILVLVFTAIYGLYLIIKSKIIH